MLLGTYRNPTDAYVTAGLAGLMIYGADAIAGADSEEDWLHLKRLGTTGLYLAAVTTAWSLYVSASNPTPEKLLIPVPIFLGLHFLIFHGAEILAPSPAPASPLADCQSALHFAFNNSTGYRILSLSRVGDAYRGFLPASKQDLDLASGYSVDCFGRSVQTGKLTLASADWSRHLGRKVVDRPDEPPSLQAAVDLVDPLGERAIHAELGGELVLTVKNTGRGPAQDAVATLALASHIPGLSLPDEVELGDIAPGKAQTVRIPVGAVRSIADHTVDLRIAVKDGAGFDAAPLPVRFRTEALRVADFAVEEVGAESQDGALLARGVPMEVRVRVRNKGRGPSKGGHVVLTAGDPALAGGSSALAVLDATASLGELAPGAATVATFSLLVNHAYVGPPRLSLTLQFGDANPESARIAPATVTLHQEAPAVRLVRIAPRVRVATLATDAGAQLAVDIDQPLGARRPLRPGAIAVLIGIERYRDAGFPAVPFVSRDVAAMREVALGLLGIGPDNLLVLADEQATKGQIEVAIEEKLRALVEPGKSDVFVYFAGHGTLDQDAGQPYLLGYDSEPGRARSGYGVPQLLRALGAARAHSVTVVLDAGFNGLASRDDQGVSLLAGSRPISLLANQAGQWQVPAGVTLLAAGKPDQSPLAFPAKGHGLYSYFLIKGLREAAERGEAVTADSLHGYALREVGRIAQRLEHAQDPLLRGQGGTLLLDRAAGGR